MHKEQIKYDLIFSQSAMYRAFMLQLSACKVSNNAFMMKETKRFIVPNEDKL